MQVNSKNLSEIFQVTPKTITLWVRGGCPKIKRGTFDIRAVLLWWAENIYLPKMAAGQGDESLKAARQKYWSAKAKREKIQVQKLEGELVSAADVKHQAFTCARQVRDSILNVPYRVGPILAAQRDPQKIETILNKELSQALEQLADVSKK